MGVMKRPQQADEQLFDFLNGLLQQVEDTSGVHEPEMRAQIEALRTEIHRLTYASSSEMSPVEVASELDRLSIKLDSVATMVKDAAANPQVQSLLVGSADLWMPVITASADERHANASREDPTPVPD